MDSQQNVKKYVAISDISEIIDDQQEPSGFIQLQKKCYQKLASSRLVNHEETDEEAMAHFQEWCNKSLPRNPAEEEMKHAIRELYYADRDGFNRCLNGAPHYVLLTEARAIVLHFGIHYRVYITWDGASYTVERNTRMINTVDVTSDSAVDKKPFVSKKYERRQQREPREKRLMRTKYVRKDELNKNNEQREQREQREKPEKPEKREKRERRNTGFIQQLSDRLERLEKAAEKNNKLPEENVNAKNPFESLATPSGPWGDIAETEAFENTKLK
jgi:hypothetical protein